MPLQHDQSERLFEISAALDWGTLKRRKRRAPIVERDLQVASA